MIGVVMTKGATVLRRRRFKLHVGELRPGLELEAFVLVDYM